MKNNRDTMYWSIIALVLSTTSLALSIMRLLLL